MNQWSIQCESLEQTRKLGNCLGKLVQPGTVVSLVGDLGAGKTQFTIAVAEGLGIDGESVSSPTFMLIHEYSGRIPLYHFDTYRVRDSDEFADLGVDEYFFGDGVCLVEWGDRFHEFLPEDLLRIEIGILGETQRRLNISACGTHSESLLNNLITTASGA